VPCGRSICWISIATLPLSLLQVESVCQSLVEVQEVDSDAQDLPILFDKTVIDALVERCRRFGFRVPGELPPNRQLWRLEPVATAYQTSRLKTADCGSGHIRRSRRTIGPLVCQDEQNRHTLLRVIRGSIQPFQNVYP
jgi:hypothetical protein